jgi:hypothetical protein
MRFLIASRALANTAFVLWGVSLLLPALYTRQGSDVFGYVVLFTAWFLPATTWNLAWIANPLLIRSFIRLRRGDPPGPAAAVAALVALDTFRITRLAVGGGGADESLYGYGVGAIVWLLSVFLMAIAAGRLEAEQVGRGKEPDPEAAFAGKLGAILAAVLVLAVGFQAASGRVKIAPGQPGGLQVPVFERSLAGSAYPVTRPPERPAPS